MINSERELEDYICDNQEEFIETLHSILDLSNETKINFIGRQVRLGNDNIIDLLYYFNDYFDGKNFIRNYIVVELKFRQLEPKDLSQISRYITILNDKIESLQDITTIFGVFVSFGLNRDMQEISCSKILKDNIYFLKISEQLIYTQEDYEKKKEYLEQTQLDERIEQFYGKSN